MLAKPIRSRFCPRCGHNVLTVKGRHRRDCKKCGTATKPRQPKALRRAKVLGWKRAEVKAAGDLTNEQWWAILDFHGSLCAYCELRPWKQQDHLQPISKGGKHTAANVVPACEFCNYAKGCSTRWEPKRKHPFMVKAQAEARALALQESFDTAGLDMGGVK